VHVLICAAADGHVPRRGEPGRPDGGPGVLAAAWAAAAPHCTVEPVVLDAAPPDADRPASPGVFVPVTSLGLRSAREQVPAAVARLRESVASADLVVVHVPVLDAAALRAAPVEVAVAAAGPHAVPVVVLAGHVEATRREQAAAGIAGAHDIGDGAAGSGDAVARVARTWAPVWSTSSR
jgi:hypothetical protein